MLAASILSLAAGSVAADRTNPLSHQPVEDGLHELQSAPSEDAGKESLADEVLRHWPWLAGFAAFLGLLAVYARRLNRKVHVVLGEKDRELEHARQTEQALRASESKYRTLYNSSRDAIMIVSPERGFLSGNPAAVELFGCKDEKEFTSSSPADLSPQYQPDGTLSSVKAQRMMAIAIREGSHFIEWTHRRTDGGEFFTTVLITAMELDGEKVVLATVRDISKQKRAEEELRQSAERLRLHFQQSSLAVIQWDAEFRVVHWNPAAERIFGYTAAEAVGRHATFMVPRLTPRLASTAFGTESRANKVTRRAPTRIAPRTAGSSNAAGTTPR